MMLTQEQVDSYHANGYVGIEDVIPARVVEELQRVTDAFVERSREVTEHTDIFDLEPGHTREHPKLRRLKHPIVQHEIYREALHNEDILTMVSQLIGHGLRCNGDKLNLKLPEVGSPVEWHQDWAFYPHTNDDLLAVGICIDDMTVENGALLVVPGSHRGPVYDHHIEAGFCGAITDPAFSDEDAVPVELAAGGISIHHVRTVHGSTPNRSGKPRRLLLFQYCAIDAWPIVHFTDWDAFNGTIIRGEPTNVPRVEPVPVRMPMPEALRSDVIYELQTAMKERKLA